MADRKKTNTRDTESTRGDDANRDPITKAPGSHPVGTGVGAAAAGTAGAAIGAMAGPIGAVAGAIIGSAIGGAAGHAVGERLDPTVEDTYWRENYRSRDYVTPDTDYETYQPAYRYGWESYATYYGGPDAPRRDFDEVESDLSRDWENQRGDKNRLEWDQARPAVRDAWNRLGDRFSSENSGRDTERSKNI